MNLPRRRFLALPALLVVPAWFAARRAWPAAASSEVAYPEVRAGRSLQFPRDHGSHPDYRTEWWYLTGRLRPVATTKGAPDAELGMQITFFRNRPGIGEDSASRFAPRQLLFAHAALSDPRAGHLLHDQRAAREGFGLASASDLDTGLRVEDWTLRREDGVYAAEIVAGEFAYSLRFRPTQALLLQGEAGYSRKGPDARHASYYYSQPHLSVSGSVTAKGVRREVTGTAWLDHEWSSQGMAAGAVGWDWTGINLADGGALMAFRMRDPAGRALWAGGALRDAAGRVRTFRPDEVAFMPLRRWRSPRTQLEYPVAMRLRAGDREVMLSPIMDDQELDSRASTGAIYWEGAVDAASGSAPVGQGYLELTGYGKPLKM